MCCVVPMFGEKWRSEPLIAPAVWEKKHRIFQSQNIVVEEIYGKKEGDLRKEAIISEPIEEKKGVVFEQLVKSTEFYLIMGMYQDIFLVYGTDAKR